MLIAQHHKRTQPQLSTSFSVTLCQVVPVTNLTTEKHSNQYPQLVSPAPLPRTSSCKYPATAALCPDWCASVPACAGRTACVASRS